MDQQALTANEFKVEAIVGHQGGKFLVKWEGLVLQLVRDGAEPLTASRRRTTRGSRWRTSLAAPL